MDEENKIPTEIRKSSFKPVESDQFQIGPRNIRHVLVFECSRTLINRVTDNSDNARDNEMSRLLG